MNRNVANGYLAVKRGADLAIALIVTLIFLPMLALLVPALWLIQGRPLFFGQERLGREGAPIHLLKIRSMRLNSIAPETLGQVRLDSELVTPMGRLLRRSKVDELPQIWSVLTGRLSLVGPRPALTTALNGYCPMQQKRLQVKPGLTGWAQVNGNAELTWDERIALDVWYVDHRSFLLDFRILTETVAVVLRGERRNMRNVREAVTYAKSLDRCGREHQYSATDPV